MLHLSLTMPWDSAIPVTHFQFNERSFDMLAWPFHEKFRVWTSDTHEWPWTRKPLSHGRGAVGVFAELQRAQIGLPRKHGLQRDEGTAKASGGAAPFSRNEGNDGELNENFVFLNFHSSTMLLTFSSNKIQHIIVVNVLWLSQSHWKWKVKNLEWTCYDITKYDTIALTLFHWTLSLIVIKYNIDDFSLLVPNTDTAPTAGNSGIPATEPRDKVSPAAEHRRIFNYGGARLSGFTPRPATTYVSKGKGSGNRGKKKIQTCTAIHNCRESRIVQPWTGSIIDNLWCNSSDCPHLLDGKIPPSLFSWGLWAFVVPAWRWK